MSRKNKKPDYFDQEQERLHVYLSKLDVNSDEYVKTQEALARVIKARADTKESKRRLTKDGKATIWAKIIGGIGTLAGIGALGYYEMKGNTFSGEKRKLADGLTGLICGLFKNK